MFFLKNGYSLTITNIIKNTFLPIIIIIFTELFRYNIIRSNKNKFKMIIIFTILLTILEIQMNMAIAIKWGFEEIFIAVTTLVIPIVAKNMILSYVTYEIGYQPCLIYRLILEIYIYLVPYLPKFGDYLNSMFGLILPIVVFSFTSTDVDEADSNIEPEFTAKRSRIIRMPIYFTMFIAIALISRVFPVFAIGIGSESMTGAINKGDAVFAIRAKEENIDVDDIIVFQTQNKILIHRVVEIEDISGVKYFRTKGDINGTRDNIDITIDKVYGKVFFRVPYIAYPSVWLSEFMQEQN